jgi:DNA polymerase III delta subunit
MFIFLYGPDDYRRLRKKNDLIADFRKKHSSFGMDFFDFEEDGAADRLREFARSQSIFENVKLAVLENSFEMEPAKLAKVLKPLAGNQGTTILISERDKPVKALSFLIEKPSLSQKFENLEAGDFISFIKEQAKKLEMKISDSAAQFLGTVYAGNSWALVTELEKISALKSFIDKADLDALDLEVAPDYWALLNGLKSYDVRVRLFALEKMLALNDPPPKIFNILAAQAGEKIPRMAEYDLAVKSGKLDYEEALLDLVVS